MQIDAHGVPKAMTGSFAIVADTFDHHVNTGFTYWFVDIATPWKYLLVLTGVDVKLLQYCQNLVRCHRRFFMQFSGSGHGAFFSSNSCTEKFSQLNGCIHAESPPALRKAGIQ